MSGFPVRKRDKQAAEGRLTNPLAFAVSQNTKHLADFMVSNPVIRWVWTGPGNEDYSSALGDFRPSDREWAETLELGERLELIPYAPRRRALELQRDSEALLLLIPEAGGRGRGVLSGKVFEYLAAERPILAVVPPDGAAAELLRETGVGVLVAPDDVDGVERELTALREAWRAGDLEATRLDDEWRRKLSRRTRVEELAQLLEELVP